MDRFSYVAGVCGEIKVDKSTKNSLVYAQNLEYKLGHFFDKAAEGSVGF